MEIQRGTDMDRVIVTKSKLNGIADAIRDKAKIVEDMTLDEMKENIENLKLGTVSPISVPMARRGVIFEKSYFCVEV